MKKPFLHALAAAIYIVIIVFGVDAITKAIENENILIPMAILSLFVLSAAVMGYLFVFEPARLYADGNKKEAAAFFGKTVAIFACFAVLFLLALAIFS